MDVPVLKRLITVEEFHRMGDAGVFPPEERIELIDGEILSMTPRGPRHAGCVNRLTRRLVPKLGGILQLTPQNPIILNDTTEPQPDIVLVRARADDYSQAHPRPQDVVLVVEVADSSAEYDRRIKLPRGRPRRPAQPAGPVRRGHRRRRRAAP
jgi:Uma2 family endonuclease